MLCITSLFSLCNVDENPLSLIVFLGLRLLKPSLNIFLSYPTESKWPSHFFYLSSNETVMWNETKTSVLRSWKSWSAALSRCVKLFNIHIHWRSKFFGHFQQLRAQNTHLRTKITSCWKNNNSHIIYTKSYANKIYIFQHFCSQLFGTIFFSLVIQIPYYGMFLSNLNKFCNKKFTRGIWTIPYCCLKITSYLILTIVYYNTFYNIKIKFTFKILWIND